MILKGCMFNLKFDSFLSFCGTLKATLLHLRIGMEALYPHLAILILIASHAEQTFICVVVCVPSGLSVML